MQINLHRYNNSTGDVHEWDEDAKAYIFIGNVGHRTFEQFLEDDEDFYYDS